MSSNPVIANATDLAVAVGEIKTDVKHILTNTERRLSAGERFQASAQEEFNVLSNRVTAVESSLGSSLKWVTAILAVTTIGVNILIRLL